MKPFKTKKSDVVTNEQYTKPVSSKPDKETWAKLRHNPESYRELYPQIDWSSEREHTVVMAKEAPLIVHLNKEGTEVAYEFWAEEEGKGLGRFLTTNLSLLKEIAKCDWGQTNLRAKKLHITRTGNEYRVKDLTTYLKPAKDHSQEKRFWKPQGA